MFTRCRLYHLKHRQTKLDPAYYLYRRVAGVGSNFATLVSRVCATLHNPHSCLWPTRKKIKMNPNNRVQTIAHLWRAQSDPFRWKQGHMDPIVIFPILIPVLLVAFALFDVLVRRLHRDLPDEWTAQGKPNGMFWQPTFASRFSLRADFAKQKLMFRWLFQTPEWMQDRPDNTLMILRCLRLSVLIWNVGFIAWAVLMSRTA